MTGGGLSRHWPGWVPGVDSVDRAVESGSAMTSARALAERLALAERTENIR